MRKRLEESQGAFPSCINSFVKDVIEDLRLGEYFEEKPFGQGDVDFDSYIGAMKEIGYNGFFTIERETGTDPVFDIIKAKQFLDKY